MCYSENSGWQEWKSELILAIARRKGFRHQELPDVHQQVCMGLLGFQYDPEKACGATEKTVLSFLIAKQLTHIQRTAFRRRKNTARVHQERYPHGVLPELDEQQFDQERRNVLNDDVRVAMATLSQQEQTVCRELQTGKPRSEIAVRLRMSRHGLDRIVEGIRVKFDALGLHEWVRK